MGQRSLPHEEFTSFGDLLKYLRRRAMLTQQELSIAVGYSEAQISRLENNQRTPDLHNLAALFVPALHLEEEPALVARLIKLASETPPAARSASSASRRARKPFIPKTNVPAELTSFIGRKEELGRVCDLLSQPGTRLLTLTGSGGCGKTRLGLRSANAMALGFVHGVWLAELAPLSDPDLVPQAVTAALGMVAIGGRPLFSALTDYLRDLCLLLILDNCEHLLLACAQLAESLLRSCPGLKILATSREPLGVPGELTFRVPSLSLPPDESELPQSFAQIAASEAVQLFIERARQVSSTFAVTDSESAALAHICCRLDGIPLAIELAAARIGALSLEQIADRLDDRFHLLTGSNRTALPRHRTLRASMDWSYSLLSLEERLLLMRLSVFVGGWTLEAAEEICAENDPDQVLLLRDQVVDVLGELVDKSLIQFDRSPGKQPRYQMLEAVRQYACEKLANEQPDNGKPDENSPRVAVLNRHSRYYLHLLLLHSSQLQMGTRYRQLPVIDADESNIQASIDWLLEQAQTEFLYEVTDTLYSYFWSQSKFEKGETVFRRIKRSLNTTGEHHQRVAMQVLARHSAFQFLLGMGNDEQSASGLETSLAFARLSGDDREIAFCLRFLGNHARWQGAIALGHERYLECLHIYEKLSDQAGVAWVLVELGGTEEHVGNHQQARELYERSLLINQALDNEDMVAICLDKLGAVAFYLGDYEKSEEYYRRSQSIFEEIGDPLGQALALGGLAWNHWVHGGAQLAKAEACMCRSMEICRKAGYLFHLVDRVGLYGLILNSQGRYEACRQSALECLSILENHRKTTIPPLLLTVLGQAETWLGDLATAGEHFYQALSDGMETRKPPTVAITLLCCAELFITRGNRLPDGEARAEWLREAYALVAFITNLPTAWKATRDAAAVMMKGLGDQEGRRLPGESLSAVVEQTLRLLKNR